MDAEAMRGVTDFFDGLEDPRVVGRCDHLLIDIVMIALVATMGDTDDWDEVAMFGEVHRDWFATFLKLPNGIPSHDTFARVFARLDPAQMNTCFERWMTHLYALLNPESGGRKTIAIDGKTLRGSNKARGATDQKTLHLVSAWAQETKLVLRQVACDEKSNEITAIPELIKTMALKGCTVTIDAMGCQKEIARQLHEKKAGYALALKDNHEKLHTQAVLLMDEVEDGSGRIASSTHRTEGRGHGRHEVREYTTVKLNAKTAYRFPEEIVAAWPGLQAIGQVTATRTIKDKTTSQTRYYLLTDDDVKYFAQAVRGHWGIENSAHWVLDVIFGEDANRTSKDHGPENLAIFRRLAMNLFRANREHNKIALKRQRKMIGWDINSVHILLNGVF